jgi:uncharacterized protein YjiS (DUF1127 family)
MADIGYTRDYDGTRFLSRLGAKLWNVMEALATANSRARQVEALSAMSDEELAKRGLRREDIVQHVFRDAMYM